MDIEGPLTLAEVAATFGVSHRSLRFYEEQGLLHPQHRGATRIYESADIVRVQLILKGRKLGFSLDEIGQPILSRRAGCKAEPPMQIAELSPSEVAARIAALVAERQRLDAAIAELRAALDRVTEGGDDVSA